MLTHRYQNLEQHIRQNKNLKLSQNKNQKLSQNMAKRDRPVFFSSSLAVLSILLMTLMVVALVITGQSWGVNGLSATPTHIGNGSVAILLLLVSINEKFSPRPLINRRLRQQSRKLAAEWAEAFYGVWAWALVILLALNFWLS